MSKFGINNDSGFSGDQSFHSAISGVMKSLEADGASGGDDSYGQAVTLRNESNAGIRTTIASTSQTHAQSIVDSLNFDSPLKDATDGTMTEHLKMRQEKMRERAMAAAQLGYAMGMGAQSLVDRRLTRPAAGNADDVLMPSVGQTAQLRLRQEAFRNIDVRRTVAFSMGFNAAMTRQTDVVMAWFPPIFLNPDQVALEISLNLLVVYDGANHDISGVRTDFKRVNVVRGFGDPTILGRHETQIIPVFRDESKDKFVDETIFPAYDKVLSRTKTKTSYLKFNQDVNLLGISQTEALLKTGNADNRDVMEPGVKLESLLVKVGPDVIALPVIGLKGAVFTGAQQHDQQEVLLNMRTNVAIGRNLKDYNGQPLTGALAALAAGDIRLKFALNAAGNVNVETGNANLTMPSARVLQIVDAATQEELPAGATRTALEEAIATMEFLGYELRSFRTNATRRQIGQRINTRRFNFHFPVVYRDPISAERPAHMGQEQDAQDLTNLQSLVRMRIENEVIDKIIEVARTSEIFVDMRDCDAEATDMEGLAHFYLKRAFHKETIHMPDHVDSIKSADRAKDIQAALIVKLRDVASRLYTVSEFKAGTDWFSGGTMAAPQVNVLTDPIIARYLLEPGELRTLGDFEMVLTSTLNNLVSGQIFMSFRMPGQEASNEPCIFNFGHLITSTELVLAANMNRNGSYFAETQLQPRYELVVMNNIMAHFTVTGIPEVLGKVAMKTQFSDPVRVDGIVMTQETPATP